MSKHFSDEYELDDTTVEQDNSMYEEFVDKGLALPREQLIEAAKALEQHVNYLAAVRETVNVWHYTPNLITPRYLAVVEDILATAEQLAGIQR